jgi:hypothetical protein
MRLRKQKRRPWGDVAGEANPQTFHVRGSAPTFVAMKMQTQNANVNENDSHL